MTMRRQTKSSDGRHDAVQDTLRALKEEEATCGSTFDELKGVTFAVKTQYLGE